jgi:hypothetical protein
MKNKIKLNKNEHLTRNKIISHPASDSTSTNMKRYTQHPRKKRVHSASTLPILGERERKGEPAKHLFQPGNTWNLVSNAYIPYPFYFILFS